MKRRFFLVGSLITTAAAFFGIGTRRTVSQWMKENGLRFQILESWAFGGMPRYIFTLIDDKTSLAGGHYAVEGVKLNEAISLAERRMIGGVFHFKRADMNKIAPLEPVVRMPNGHILCGYKMEVVKTVFVPSTLVC